MNSISVLIWEDFIKVCIKPVSDRKATVIIKIIGLYLFDSSPAFCEIRPCVSLFVYLFRHFQIVYKHTYFTIL